uniref:MarC family protein n=1 Tax=Methylobacterium nigriterrae TaxID=3127512 RepID=UPI003013F09A
GSVTAHVSPSITSAFVTLFATIGPIETAVLFASLTSGVHRPERARLALRSVLIAGVMLLAFALGGAPILDYLHVSVPAFQVAGGIMLFLQALTLVFSSPGLSSLSEGEKKEARGPGDIAVFPLAFPVIASPGALVAVVLLMGRAEDMVEGAAVLAMLVICLLLTYIALRAGEVLMRWLGRTGSDVAGRIMGVLLAGLAVQFVFDG